MNPRNGVLVIAEAGVNHNGDMTIAKKLIDIAAEAGADIVKFQTFRTELLVTRFAPQAVYQAENTRKAESQYEMLKRLEIGRPEHDTLLAHCKLRSIDFLSTAFDYDSIELLKGLGMPMWKVPSGELTNLGYLRKIGELRTKVVLSTGMANMSDIERALGVLEAAGTAHDDITVLHCTTEYPTPWDEVNLKAMVTIGDAFRVKIGYSDHTPGIEVATAAVAMGATIIEKHFTVDKNLPGPDHRASLEPQELAAMVSAIRNIEQALGDGRKRPTKSELLNMAVARKSLVAARRIQKGELFGLDNVTVKRPGSGLSPVLLETLVGTPATRMFEPDELISL